MANAPLGSPDSGCGCPRGLRYEPSGKDSSVETMARAVELAFYGGNFTGLPVEVQEALLEHAASYIGRRYRQPPTEGSLPESNDAEPNRQPLTGIRVSTRPDHLDTDTIKRLKGYGVTTVEIGAQTMVAEILESLQRDHTPDDTARAVKRLQEAGIITGVHLMAGLPGERAGQAVFSAEAVAELQPDHVRIHPLVVLEGSPLAGLWRQGGFRPLSLTATVRRMAGMVHIFQMHGTPVARMGLHPPQGGWGKTLLAGPWHPAISELVHTFLFRRKIWKALRKVIHLTLHTRNTEGEWESSISKISFTSKTAMFEIHINPRDLSRAVGYKRMNAKLLKRILGTKPAFVEDAAIQEGTVKIENKVR